MDSNEKLTVAGLLIAAIIVTALVMTFTLKVPSTGKLKKIGVEIYTDSTGATPLNSIDWGILGPGETAEVTAYIKGIGNKPVNLTLTTGSWVPVNAANYLTLTWDYPSGRVLQPGEMIAIKFRLSVSPSIVGIDNFSFDIIVTATG